MMLDWYVKDKINQMIIMIENWEEINELIVIYIINKIELHQGCNPSKKSQTKLTKYQTKLQYQNKKLVISEYIDQREKLIKFSGYTYNLSTNDESELDH